MPILHLLIQDTSRFGGTAGPDLSWLVTMVAILLAGIIGVAFGLRRIVGGSLRGRAAKRALSVVDVLPLGGRRRLTIVRCYDRTFALGLGDKEVSLVAELDHELVDHERAGASEARPEAEFTKLIVAAKARLASATQERRRGSTSRAAKRAAAPSEAPSEEGIVA